MTTLEEKVIEIIDFSDFDELPKDERERIGEYMARQQILTLWQVLTRHEDLTTKAWRKKIRAWLENCVRTAEKRSEE